LPKPAFSPFQCALVSLAVGVDVYTCSVVGIGQPVSEVDGAVRGEEDAGTTFLALLELAGIAGAIIEGDVLDVAATR
jgi:hypothetical protein